VFLPFLASVIETSGCRTAAVAVAGAAVIVFVLVLLFMRDRPEDMGLRPYGQRHDEGAAAARARMVSSARI
jgi:sugar phosphate permease